MCWWAVPVQAQAPPSPRQQCQVSLCVFFGAVANPPTRHTQSPTVRLSVLYVCVMSVPQATTAHGPIYPTCQSTSVSHTHAHSDSAWSVWADTWKVDFCTTLSNISRLKTGHVFVCVCVCVLGCIWIVMNWQYELKVFHLPASLEAEKCHFLLKYSVVFQVNMQNIPVVWDYLFYRPVNCLKTIPLFLQFNLNDILWL